MQTIRVSFSLAFLIIWISMITPGAAAKDVTPPLYTTKTLTGQAVKSQHGEEVGQINDVVIEVATGRVIYAVLTSGGFLGLGEQLFAIPWRALQQSTNSQAFRLPMTAEQLKQAPRFDQDRWPDLEDRHWGDEIYAYYGQPPHWGQKLPAQSADQPEEPAQYHLLRASVVVESQVMNPRGQRLGDLEEVVIDAAAGQVSYVVLSVGTFLGLNEKWIAVPWRALKQAPGLGTFTLDVEKKALQDAPGFDKDHWPDRATMQWAD